MIAGSVKRSSRRAKRKIMAAAIINGRILLMFVILSVVMKIDAEIIKERNIPTPPRRGMFPE